MTSPLDEHWESVYTRRAPDSVSWYTPDHTDTVAQIRAAGIPVSAPILDVGGGASELVDALLSAGFTSLSVLDLSPSALAASRARLGRRADGVRWLVGDVLAVPLGGPFALWHDRAVFHFLVEPSRRETYRERLHAHLGEGGQAMVSTFAPGGPERCSGLPVQRYAPEEIADTLGLRLVRGARHAHGTPDGRIQAFSVAWLAR